MFERKFEGSPLWKGVLIIGSGTALAQLVAVITTPIITRLYTPSDFGLLGIYMAILTIFTVLATLKYEYAIPIPKNDTKAANLLVLCILMTVGFAFFLLLAFIIVGKNIFAFFNYQELLPYFWLIIIGILGSGVYQSLSYWAIRQRDYPRLSLTKINQNISGSLTKIVFGVLFSGPFGLLFGYLISNIAGIGTFIKSIREKDLDHINGVSIKNIKSVAKEFWQYPVYAAPSAVILTFSLQMPIFFLTFMYGFQVVGYYSLAYQVLTLPLSLIAYSISQVFHGEAAKYVRDSPKYLKDLQVGTTKKLALLSLPCIGIPALFAPLLFPIIFGANWVDAGWYILPLTLVAISQFIVDPINKLVVYGFNDWELGFNIFRIIIFTGGFILSIMFTVTPIVTLLIYGMMTILTQVILYFLNISAINRLNRNNIS